ncbi:hypothetical protein JB92DRAFT_2083594 [Gautieria morchelliformis]|nr:hypothetical protein JB92DRAFT_2083594 [Gautieria morchelliformis]
MRTMRSCTTSSARHKATPGSSRCPRTSLRACVCASRTPSARAWMRAAHRPAPARADTRPRPRRRPSSTPPQTPPVPAPFEAAVRALNPVVAVKLRSAAVHAALGSVSPTSPHIHVDGETRIQIVETMARLPRADKEQCAAFVRDERVLIVWSDALDAIIPTCHEFQRKLTALVMRQLASPTSTPGPGPDGRASVALSAVEAGSEKPLAPAAGAGTGTGTTRTAKARPPRKKGRTCWGFGHVPVDKKDANDAAAADEKNGMGMDGDVVGGAGGKRKIQLLAPFYGGCACGLSFLFMGTGLRVLLSEWRLDGGFARFGLCVTMPFVFCISLFFCLQIVGNISFFIGPVSQYHENSKYYSAQKPAPNRAVDDCLPHITIQMPVYKESLEQTM